MGEKIKRGLTSATIGYLNNKQVGLVTIDDLVKEFSDWSREQILQTMANLLNPNYTANNPIKGLKKIQTGVWSLEKVDETKVNTGTNTMVVTILKQNDGHIIGVDEEFNIYKMTLVG